MPVVEILGHPTWYASQGAGDETVLLLHGGLSNSDVLLDGIGGPLGAHRRVVAFDRRGHGRTADTPAPFHYDSMVDETIAFIEHVGAPVHIVGWSDGGIIGLLLALRQPELVGRLVVIGANYHWNVAPDADDPPPNESDADASAPADGDRDASQLEEADDVAEDEGPVFALLAADYAERSPDGAEHFAIVAAKATHLFGSEPELTLEDLAAVSVPVLVMAGDDDIIPLDHTASLFAGLPEAQLAIVAGASHGLPMEHPQEVAGLIERFLGSVVPPVTIMPHRRS